MRKNFEQTLVTAGILAAAVLFAMAAPGQPTPTPTGKNWTITVGPGPCDLSENGKPAPKQTISKSKQHKIVWKPDAGQSLSIVVHVPANCPAPFKNMTKGGKDKQGNDLWTVDCTKDTCKSGPPVKNACEREYKYDQILGGKSCDGLIIIQP
jgi:hypothetical protein